MGTYWKQSASFVSCLSLIYGDKMLKSSGELFWPILVLWLFDLLMGETKKTQFLWFRHFRTCPRAPKRTIFIFGGPRIPRTIQEKSPPFLNDIIFINLEILGHRKLCKFEKRRAPWHLDDPFDKILGILDVGSISSWRHEMEIESYGINTFPKTWNAMLKLWTFETL